MTKLLDQFVYMLSRHGDVHYDDNPYDAVVTNPGGQMNLQHKAAIIKLLKDANFFFIEPEAILPEREAEHVTAELIDSGLDPENYELSLGTSAELLDKDIAPPFETCWFQLPENPNATKLDDVVLRGLVDSSSQEEVYALFIHELSPHNYLFAMLLRDIHRAKSIRLRIGRCSPEEDSPMWNAIVAWLQPFGRKSRFGVQRSHEKVKYKQGGENKFLRIKRIVYVYPHRETPDHKRTASERRLEFSHRFQVRGHWRKIAGIGKNRADEYVVSGYTYVREHEKGPEHMPVIKKTRVVMDPKENE